MKLTTHPITTGYGREEQVQNVVQCHVAEVGLNFHIRVETYDREWSEEEDWPPEQELVIFLDDGSEWLGRIRIVTPDGATHRVVE